MCQIHKAMETSVVHRTPLNPTEQLHNVRRPLLQTLQVPVYDPTTDRKYPKFLYIKISCLETRGVPEIFRRLLMGY